MSERVRARQSPLRDLMLELHRLGIEVKFYDGRPGHPDADVFFVKMPAGFSMEETCKILSRIHKAMDESVGLRPQPLLSYQSASAYIGQMDELGRDSSKKIIPQEAESIDLQEPESDVFPSQEVQNGRKKERQLNLLL